MSISLQDLYHPQVGLINKLNEYCSYSDESNLHNKNKLYNVSDIIYDKFIYYNNELAIGYMKCVLQNNRKRYNGIHIDNLLILPNYRHLLSQIIKDCDQTCVSLMQLAHQHDIYIDLPTTDVAGSKDSTVVTQSDYQYLQEAFIQMGYSWNPEAKTLHKHIN